MNARRWLTLSELNEARRLYVEEGLNWREVGRRLGRNGEVIAKRLSEYSRSYSESHRLLWTKKPDGPRHLTPEQHKIFRKLKHGGLKSSDAFKEARS